MIITIEAPEGFEAGRWYDDGTREWRACFRRLGDTWWTVALYPVGHAHLTDDELDRRAADAVHRDIALRFPTAA